MTASSLPEGASILVVDDDHVFRDRLARALRKRGFEVSAASGFDEAMALVHTEAPEFAVLDLKMPGKSGMELLPAILAVEPATRVVILTGYGSIASALDAVRLGAVWYVSKPADADEVLAAFDRGQSEPLEATQVDYQAPTLARAEWEHINRVLADCGGNVSEAARRLGLHRRSLQRKLSKYPPKV